MLPKRDFSDAIVNSLPGTFYMYDEQGTMVRWNDKAIEITEYPAHEIARIHPLDFFEGEDRTRVEQAIGRVFTEGAADVEAMLITRTGKRIPFHFSGKRMTINGRNYMVGMGIETAAQRGTERALQKAEEERSRLLNILERSLNEVYIFDPDSLRFRYVNAGALGNLGYSRSDIESLTPVDLKPQFTEASFRALLEPLLAGLKDKEVFRTEHRRADGSLYPVEVHLQLVEHEKERMFLAVIIDITERKRAEEDKKRLQTQLLHSQKMEAVGQLAGGIAHDFNNILTAIIGYGNVALMSTGEDNPVRPYIDQMLSAADRAATLTQNLLAFSRRQIINPRAVSANGIIERVQKLLHRIIGEDITLTTSLSPGDATVLADVGQIEQVLINLCTNARDAMPDGGHLAIETAHAAIGDDYIRTHGYGKIGEYVLITVTDDGHGMDEQTRQRIFEPFFTTKEVGKGTGLGLAMAYGIVKQHSGYINVDSEPGRGTTFRIYLPRHCSAAPAIEASGAVPLPRGGTETVLLAEDDAQIRKLARSVLESFGYTVIEAADGADAVKKFHEHRETVQIIIVDVVMPGKNGREVYEAARKIKPGVKVLFTSGYPSNVIASKGVLEPGITLLAKPLAPQDLLRAVRAALDA